MAQDLCARLREKKLISIVRGAPTEKITKIADAIYRGGFLPFEVLSIDIDRAIWVNMDRVYAEARTLLSNGFRYWFDDAEIEELHRGNAAFHVQTIEYEMLLKGFEKPPEHAVTDCFMTTVEILDYLRSYSSLNLSEKRMGEALRKAGFERRSKRVNGNPVYGWVIEKITPNPFVSYGL